MRQRRKSRYAPSSGHHLALLVASEHGNLSLNPKTIRAKLESEETLPRVANLAGVAGAAWAIDQLSTKPHVVKGWPNPCKSARIAMPKSPQRHGPSTGDPDRKAVSA